MNLTVPASRVADLIHDALESVGIAEALAATGWTPPSEEASDADPPA